MFFTTAMQRRVPSQHYSLHREAPYNKPAPSPQGSIKSSGPRPPPLIGQTNQLNPPSATRHPRRLHNKAGIENRGRRHN